MAHVANQRRRGEFQRVYRADGVSFEELEMTLLASLHLEIVSSVSMYQRMSAASVTSSCCLRPGTAWFSSCTSRSLAQLAAAARRASALHSWWTRIFPFRIRTIAVYRVVPSDCLRGRIVVMVNLEVTSYSCHLYVTSETRKLPGMPINPAETPDSKMPIIVGISADVSREKLDRRVSVAPMMDWTDQVNLTNKIINLGTAKKA